jgi:16S rRNA G1207 methylase RsmC
MNDNRIKALIEQRKKDLDAYLAALESASDEEFRSIAMNPPVMAQELQDIIARADV